MSASGTCAFGGIGTCPQTPEPPFLTFFDQLRRRLRVALVLRRDVLVRRARRPSCRPRGTRRSRSSSSSSSALALSSAACARAADEHGGDEQSAMQSSSCTPSRRKARRMVPEPPRHSHARRASTASSVASSAIVGDRPAAGRSCRGTPTRRRLRAALRPWRARAGSVDAGDVDTRDTGPIARARARAARRARLARSPASSTIVGGGVEQSLERRRAASNARRATRASAGANSSHRALRRLDIARLARPDGRARSAPAPRRRCPTASRCRGRASCGGTAARGRGS